MVARYVAKTGSDSNAGTSGSPYLTIGKAASVVNAGDVVNVASGTYNERVFTTRSGTSGSRIRFVSTVLWGAKISPSSPGATDWWGSPGWRNDADYIDIDGFEIVPASNTAYVMTSGILITGGNSCNVLRNKIHSIAYNVADGGPGGINSEGGAILIDSNFIYDIGQPGSTLTHGIYVSSGTATVQNNVVARVSGFGIHTWHSVSGINAFNNTVTGCDSGGFTLGDGESTTTLTGHIIANNIAANNPGQGIREWGQVSGGQFINNTSYNNPGGNISLINGSESNTLTSNPLFANYNATPTGNADDYRLLTGSPSIDSANATYAPALDFGGVARTAPHERGAFQFTGAATAYDLVVTDITWSPAVPTLGQAVTFSATIQNIGDATTPGGTVHGISFLIDGVAVAASNNNSTALAAGASRTQAGNSATWTATAGSHTIMAWVDSTNLLTAESNEGNNQRSETIVVTGAPSDGTFIGAGTPTHGDYNVAASPPLPASVVAGDLLVCFTHLRSNGTAASTWSTIVSNDGSSTYILVSYKVATGSDAAPTITPTGTSSGQHHTSCVLAFRGIDATSPFGALGAAAQYASAEDIGPIAAATPTHADGVVIVFGARNDAVGTSVSNAALLTGNGLTWVEVVDAGSTDNFSHIVVDYAKWTGAAPALTAKTFDIPGGTTAAVSAGVMLTLKPAVNQIAYVGVGTSSVGDYIADLSPALPVGIAPGDLLLAFGYLRNEGTLSISSGWTEQLLIDTDINGSSFYLKLWYRFATFGDSPPLITIAGGSSASPTITLSFITAFRGIDQSQPFGTHGADSFNPLATNVGPIAAPSSLPANGAVLVLGARHGAVWTSTAALSGDGVTWIEEFDNYTQTVTGGYAIALAMNHAIWTGTAPTFTAKTYVPTGGTTGWGMGKMFVLRAGAAAPVTSRTAAVAGDVAVATRRTAAVSADCSVTAVTAAINVGALAAADHVTTMNPALPAGIATGDLMIAFGYLRNAGTLSISVPDINAYPVVTPETAQVADAVAYSLGTRWFSDVGGQVKGIRFYKGGTTGGNAHTVGLYTDSGTQLAVQATASETASGWQTVLFSTPISVAANTAYKAVVHWPLGYYPATPSQFVSQFDAAPLHIYANGGEYEIGASISNTTQVFNSHGYFSDVIFNASVGGQWTQHSLADTTTAQGSFYLQTWYRIYDGSTPAPTITVIGGSTTPQTLCMSFIVKASIYNQGNPFGQDGADLVTPLQTTIGPIAPPSSLPTAGTVLVVGFRHGAIWTSVPTLTGDGLTWIESFENYTNTVGGLTISAVMNYAQWSGGVPSLTAKTFSPAGTVGDPALGKMFVLNAAPSAQNTITTSASPVVAAKTTGTVFLDASVVLGTHYIELFADTNIVLEGTRTAAVSANAAIRTSGTRTVSADANVVSTTRSATVSANVSVINAATKTAALSADVSVALGKHTVSQLVFCDAMLVPSPVQEGVLTAVGELSAERTDTAWLVLLTLDHPDLPSPIRVTSDGVPTVNAGNIFSPFPFEVILPDDVEGRPPQAQLSIDNITQEIIAALRGLVSPPKVTVQIVRSTNTDIIEYQWIGLEWSTSSYDKSVITGTLTFQDITREEFPYETFDGRWQGLTTG